MGERGVLFRRRQFAVQRKDDKTIAHPRGPDGGDGAADLVFARHEDEHVAFGVRGDALELIGSEVPDGIAVAADRFREVFDLDGKLAAARGEDGAGLEIFLEQAGIERRGHDGEFQVGARGGLELEGASEGDVAVKMALVKFVEEDRGDAAQLRILDQLAEQNAFGDEADAGALGGEVFETDLVTDFVAEADVALGGDARGKETGGETARLEDDDLAGAEEAVIEEDLGDLGGFAGAGGGLEDEAGVGLEFGDDPLFELEDWQVAGHRRGNVQRPTFNVQRSTGQKELQRRRGKLRALEDLFGEGDDDGVGDSDQGGAGDEAGANRLGAFDPEPVAFGAGLGITAGLPPEKHRPEPHGETGVGRQDDAETDGDGR